MIRIIVELNNLLDVQIAMDLLKDQKLKPTLEFRSGDTWYPLTSEAPQPSKRATVKRRKKRNALSPAVIAQLQEDLIKKGYDPAQPRLKKSTKARKDIAQKYNVAPSTLGRIIQNAWSANTAH